MKNKKIIAGCMYSILFLFLCRMVNVSDILVFAETVHIQVSGRMNTAADWYLEVPEIMLHPFDEGSSFYRWNEGKAQELEKSAVLLKEEVPEGINILYLWSEDEEGEELEAEEKQVQIDITDPVITKFQITDKQGKETVCFNQSVFVSAEAEGGGSPLKGTKVTAGDNVIWFPAGESVQMELPVPFAGDVEVEAVSVSSRGSKKEKKAVLLEDTAPEIEMPVFCGDYDEESGWYRSKVEGHVLIRDFGSGISMVTIAVNGEETIYEAEGMQKSREIAFSIDPRETAGLGDGSCEIEIKAADFAGNEAAADPVTIFIETEVPEIDVSARTIFHVNEKSWSAYEEKGEGTRWTGNDVVFSLGNQNKKVVTGTYYYVRKDGGEWEQINEKPLKRRVYYRIPVVEGKNTCGQYQFKSVLEAGESLAYQEAEHPHVSEIRTVKIDGKDPQRAEISIFPSETDGENGWYRKRPYIQVTQQQDTGSDLLAAIYLYDKEQRCVAKEILPGAGTQGSVKSGLQIPEDGIYAVEVVTSDEVGREVRVRRDSIYVDGTEPLVTAIELEGTAAGSAISGYYQKPVKAMIKGEDAQSGVASFQYKLVEDMADVNDAKTRTGETFVVAPQFKGRILAYATDNAGNTTYHEEKMEEGISVPVVVEDLPPQIEISASREFGIWQKENMTITINITDDRAGLKEISYVLGGRKYTRSLDPFMYEQTIQVTAFEEAVDADGAMLYVAAEDYAGNHADAQERIKIDKTPPAIRLSGVEDGAVYKSSQILQVHVEERIYELCSGNICIERVLGNRKEEERIQELYFTGKETVEQLELSEEGIYKITVNAQDAAGNRAVSQVIRFTIDKTEPLIRIKGVDEGEFYGRDVEVQVEVEELFFTDMTVDIQIEREHNGRVKKVDTDRWQSGSRISRQNIALQQDGIYTIKVSAADRAGNSGKPQSMTFTVDKSAPVLSVQGIADEAMTSYPVLLQMEVKEEHIEKDSIEYTLKKLTTKGKEQIIELPEVQESEGLYKLEMQIEEDGIYVADLQARDLAGNTAREQVRFLIDTENPVIRYVEELDGTYMQSFQLGRSVDEMVEDLTIPSCRMFLNGQNYNGKDEVTEEGKWIFVLEAKDELGHRAKAEAAFVIDRTPPLIEMSPAREKSLPQTLEIKVSGQGDLLETVRINEEEIDLQGGCIRFTRKIRDAGNYRIEAEATDLAGNTAALSREFEWTEIEVRKGRMKKAGLVLPVLCILAGIWYSKRKTKKV